MQDNNFAGIEFRQIPKEFQPNHPPQKSPWAFILILLVLIGAGAFFYIKTKSTYPVQQTIEIQPNIPQEAPIDTTNLEEAVSSITIPDYSDLF